MTDSMLSLFDPQVAGSLREKLQDVRKATTRLFEPTCLISGDPNPANWGLRDDGTLVLYDWERCTRAAPAIDLAITVPGLGNHDSFQKVAAVYDDSGQLTPGIARAKIWVVVEFLAGCAQERTVPSFPIEPLLEQIPAWLYDVAPLSS